MGHTTTLREMFIAALALHGETWESIVGRTIHFINGYSGGLKPSMPIQGKGIGNQAPSCLTNNIKKGRPWQIYRKNNG